MSGLKSFLYAISPVIGVSPAALYERQRALVKLGLLTVAPGRGPGSGVPLSADNVAAMIICVLASESLSDVDQRVVALCNAPPDIHTAMNRLRWAKIGKPTFRSEIARLLSGEQLQWRRAAGVYQGIRISRCWRGQIMHGRGSLQPIDFFVDERDQYVSDREISITAEIEMEMLDKLVLYTRGALSQVVEEEGDEE
jgi:hypothetical protein